MKAKLFDKLPLILGIDFLSPKDLTKAYGWNYSNEQITNLTNTLPDIETIFWLYENGYILIATPPSETNLLQVYNLNSQLFYPMAKSWYNGLQQLLSRETPIKAGQWLAIRKEPHPHSCAKKTWDEQTALLSNVEYVPSVTEVAYAVTAYYKIRNIKLLYRPLVRTSSDVGTKVLNERVLIGAFYKPTNCGLLIDLSLSDNARENNIGIASARKLN